MADKFMSLLAYLDSCSTLLSWLIQKCKIYQIPELLLYVYSIFIPAKSIKHLRDEEWTKSAAISAIILSVAILNSLRRNYFSNFRPLTESVPENAHFSSTASPDDPFLAAMDTKASDLSHLISDGGLSEDEIRLRRNRFGENVLSRNRDWLQVLFTFCKYPSSITNEVRLYTPSMSG